jgi:type II secretory pathway pseudopilin PulG
MGPLITPGSSRRPPRARGYALLIFMFAITLMAFALMVAVPVWDTQMQREREAELIFRGKQYVEAIRIFQLKSPGAFPKQLEDLIDEDKRCIRRLYPDPMTKEGVWNVILQQEGFGGLAPRGGPGLGRSGLVRGGPQRQPGVAPGGAGGATKVMVAPVSALSSIQNPRIIGVVSSSTKKSVRIYNDQESYDKWLFFFGQDPKNMPEIVYYGESEKSL